MYVAESAAQKFWSFMRYHDPSGKQAASIGALQNHLLAWLEKDRGIEETGGNYVIFLQTVILAIQMLHEDPSLLDLYESPSRKVTARQIDGYYHPDGSGSCCFEQDYYETIKSLPEGRRRL